jgi:cytochrome o ubiquinol oxidase subunit IV
VENQAVQHGKLKQYVIGFVLSLVLTFIPLFFVVNHTFAKSGLIAIIMILAIAQMCIQLFFFMHVNEKDGDGPSWHGVALLLGLVIIFTIVAGSLWTMSFSSQVQ